MRRSAPFRLALILTGILALPLLSAARPTDAFHLHLKRAEPGVNDTVAVAPKVIQLWFTERPESAVARIELWGPGDAQVAVARPTLAPGDDAPLAAQVTGQVVPGAYKVVWRAMAGDGHAMRGSFGFLYRPGK